MADEFFAVPREEESLLARGEDDVLIRREKATREQFKEEIEITIDGQKVKVPKAVPLTDSLGNERRGPDGKAIPRASTIYDAAMKLFPADELRKRSTRNESLSVNENSRPAACTRSMATSSASWALSSSHR